jgi:hypothetical protein
LYFITGCDKSKSWAIAAYTEAMVSPDNVLRLQWGNSQYEWTDRGTAEARTGPSTAISGQNDEGREANDQCLFLRGFTLAFSQRFRERMSRPPSSITSTSSPGTGQSSRFNCSNPEISHSTTSPRPPGGLIDSGCSSAMLSELPEATDVGVSIALFPPSVRLMSSPMSSTIHHVFSAACNLATYSTRNC